MKVSLKNIGILDSAEFEVGDLTLICGENNTGKTYATYSLYGYLEFINNVHEPIIEDIVKKYIDSISISDCLMQVKIDTAKNILTEILKHIKNSYKANLSNMLAGKEDDFKEAIFEDNLLLNFTNFLTNIDNDKREKIESFLKNSNMFELKSIDDETISINYEKSKGAFNKQMQADINVKKINFFIALISHVFRKLYPRAFILSAERTGATMFQKELDVNKNEIVDKISQIDGGDISRAVLDIFTQRYSRYPRPVKDNIYFVRGLDEVTKNKSFIQKETTEIHSQILSLLHKVVGGKYLVSQEGIEFAPGAKSRITKGKFLIQRASSSVRALLMLNYYVLNIAQKNQILMIDEPELNLHPKNQILVARLLVLLVNAGVKVFITTHSDYIVREFGNCIMLNNLKDSQFKSLKEYTKELKLDSSRVRAYLAENQKGKNILKDIRVDSKQGIFMETFDEPINTQNENQGKIYEEVLKSEIKDD